MSSLPVIIIGAGISGLTLAQGLLKANIPFRLYEKDPSLNKRDQGYRFRVGDAGIIALSKCLPEQLFQKVNDCCAYMTSPGLIPKGRMDAVKDEEFSASLMTDRLPPNFMELMPKSQFLALNADRGVLRSVLYTGLEDHVEFGKEFLKYSKNPDGITVTFSDGSEVNGSLLVGADGTWSRVRHQMLPDYRLLDTELRLVFGKTILTPEFASKVSPTVLDGMGIIREVKDGAIDPRSPVVLLEAIRFKDNEYRSQLPEDYLYWVYFIRKEIPTGMDDETLIKLSPEKAAALTQKMSKDWLPKHQALFEHQNVANTTMVRVVTAHPNMAVWEPDHVTLMGDAIHPMAPTAAAGAVMALNDAATLTEALREGGVTPESVGKYEQQMREYAKKAIIATGFGGKFMFGMKPYDELPLVEVR